MSDSSKWRIERRNGARTGWALVGVLFVVAGAIASIGYHYILTMDVEGRAEARKDLGSVAELKVQQIVQWRKERMGDGNVLFCSSFLPRHARDFFADPARNTVRLEIVSRLASLRESYGYEWIAVLDAQPAFRLSTPKGATMDSTDLQLAKEVLQSRQLVFSDLHLDDDGKNPHVDIVFPLLLRAAPAGGGQTSDILPPVPDAPPVGVVVMRINAAEFFYPLIQSWPVPSETSETLLVRRNDQEVLFLNELRHKTNTALRLRFPIVQKDLPAAMAARGVAGLVEGNDYRGIPVLADVRPVPGTPWSLVTKVDQDEIYAHLRQNIHSTWGSLGLLTLGLCLSVTMIWRRWKEHLRHVEWRAERKTLGLKARFEHLMKSANDAILLTDEQWRILEANDRALEFHGYSLVELQQMRLLDLRAPHVRAQFERESEWLKTSTGAVLETVHQRKDGSTFPVETSDRIVSIDNERYGLVVARDITRRKAHEREIERMTRLYATLSQVNQCIVRVKSEEELALEICRVAIEFGGFKLAWVGRHDPATRVITPLACAGEPREFIENHHHGSDEREGRCCLCGPVVREDNPIISNDLRTAPEMKAWRSEINQAGLRSAAIFPVHINGKVWGVFGVYASEPDIFQEKEVALLKEAAMDVSFALDHLAQETNRQRSEAVRHESERRFREMMENIQLIGVMLDVRGNVIFCNEYLLRLTGWTRDEVMGHDWFGRFTPGNEQLKQMFFGHVAAGTIPAHVENDILTRQGARRLISWDNTMLRGELGVNIGVACIGEDITERQQAIAALRDSEQRFRGLIESVSDIVYEMTPAGIITYVSPNWQEMMGEPAANAIGKSFGPYIHPDDVQLCKDAIRQALSSGKPITSPDYRLLRRDGTFRWHYSKAVAQRGPDGSVRGIMGVSRDITERQQAEEEIRKLNAELEQRVRVRTAQLEEANKELESFSYSVSHDLRAPLRAISGYASMVIEDCAKQLDEKDRQHLAIVSAEAGRMGELIDGLLDFSRKGRQAMRMEELDMTAMAREVCDECAAQAPGRKIRFQLQALPAARGDAVLLREVWVNLISNAVKYTRNKPVAEIEVTGRAEGDELVYTVKDNGAGFNMEYAEKLFGVFQRLHGESDFEGTGVGLALAKRIIQRHGGRVRGEGKVGEGAKFCFSLPQANATV